MPASEKPRVSRGDGFLIFVLSGPFYTNSLLVMRRSPLLLNFLFKPKGETAGHILIDRSKKSRGIVGKKDRGNGRESIAKTRSKWYHKK